MILVMDAQETQILGQALTGLGTVVLSGAFGFLTYLVKKHMSSIVAWIDSYIGAKNFDRIVTFIKASIAEAEKDGIADDLTGEAKHNKVVQEVETKFSSTLKSLGIDEPALEKLVEGYWASMADTLIAAYTNTTETEAQKKLDDAKVLQAQAKETLATANATAAKATATEARLNAALAAVKDATATTAAKTDTDKDTKTTTAAKATTPEDVKTDSTSTTTATK